jgi:hypothetical protein
MLTALLLSPSLPYLPSTFLPSLVSTANTSLLLVAGPFFSTQLVAARGALAVADGHASLCLVRRRAVESGWIWRLPLLHHLLSAAGADPARGGRRGGHGSGAVRQQAGSVAHLPPQATSEFGCS